MGGKRAQSSFSLFDFLSLAGAVPFHYSSVVSKIMAPKCVNIYMLIPITCEHMNL